MTTDEAIALVMKVQNGDGELDIDECTEAASALVEVGIVFEDADGSFRPNLARLQECPEDVRMFVAGMIISNGLAESFGDDKPQDVFIFRVTVDESTIGKPGWYWRLTSDPPGSRDDDNNIGPYDTKQAAWDSYMAFCETYGN